MVDLVNLIGGALQTPAEVAALILVLAQLVNSKVLVYLKNANGDPLFAPETVVLFIFAVIWGGYSYLTSNFGWDLLPWTSVLVHFLNTLVGNAPAAITSLAIAHGSYKLAKAHRVAGFRSQAALPPAA
jgi:hypothetical protein